ncbi:MAG: acyl-CoA dehydrogenase family protein [Mycobacterium sp.]
MSATVESGPIGRQNEYVSQVDTYRQEFRAWLRDLEWADEWRSAHFDTSDDELAYHATVMARLFDAGWNRYGWPAEVGGLGGTELHRAAYYDELAAAMLPVPEQHWTLEVIGPATNHFAPQLAAEHLPNYLSGGEWWGQCFSEPESGSDLAGLRCRATDDGTGGFVLNGQKIWTSQGPTAKRFMVLARTGSADSRHRGLSTMLVDADAPGVTVRPIALASGRRELAEVFFDDVRVPHDRLIGDVNGGWGVVMYLMQYERGMYGYAMTTTALTQLGQLRDDMAVYGASADIRERFTRLYLAVIAAQARGAITVRDLAQGQMVGPESSIDKLLFAKAEKDINDLNLDVRRNWMIAGTGPQGPEKLNGARAKWWYTRAATIMGGSAEVQRGIIADHLLGLPKEKR